MARNSIRIKADRWNADKPRKPLGRPCFLTVKMDEWDSLRFFSGRKFDVTHKITGLTVSPKVIECLWNGRLYRVADSDLEGFPHDVGPWIMRPVSQRLDPLTGYGREAVELYKAGRPDLLAEYVDALTRSKVGARNMFRTFGRARDVGLPGQVKAGQDYQDEYGDFSSGGSRAPKPR